MIYAIAINGAVLAGSLHTGWDACWDTIYRYRLQEQNVSCELIEVRDSAAPTTSPRPKARTDK